MTSKFVLAAALVAAFAAPAFAATTTPAKTTMAPKKTYYVAVECKVVTTKPKSPWIEAGASYSSQADAAAALKAIAECNAAPKS